MQTYVAEIVQILSEEKLGLKINFSGCNFNCPFCYTPSLLKFSGEANKDIKEIKTEIEKNIGISSVLFTGGEPCLQKPQLVELTKYCKEKKLEVGIETNGSKPDTIKSLLNEGLVDFIALDIKAPFDEQLFEKVTKSKTFFITTSAVMQDIKETLKLLKECNEKIAVEIRTTIVPNLMYKKEDILKIADAIKELNCVWVFQQFQPNANLVDKKFSSINPPSATFLNDLKQSCIKKYPNLRIEIRSL